MTTICETATIYFADGTIEQVVRLHGRAPIHVEYHPGFVRIVDEYGHGVSYPAATVRRVETTPTEGQRLNSW